MATGESRTAHGERRRLSPDSGWRINWLGLVPLAIAAVFAVTAWRAFDLGGEGTVDAGPATSLVTSSSVPAAPAPVVAATVPAVPPLTTPPVASTTTPPTPAGPVIVAFGELGPCRFGDTCLLVGFTTTGFDPPAAQYTCVYPESRSTFSFDGVGQFQACMSGDEGDVISIEVDGVASAPVSADNLAPGPGATSSSAPSP